MPGPPRISIVTPSLDPEPGALRAIESVLAQGYPNVEHIVIAASPEGAVPARHLHLKLVSDPGRGRAAAINAGFAAATGDVRGVLDADAVLLPGALDRVAREIDPGRGRRVVLGRCRLLDAQGRFTGIEHPSRVESHRRSLEVWRGPCMSTPAAFWTREVWKMDGPLDESAPAAWVDGDLCRRLSRSHRVHHVDEALAATVLDTEGGAGRRARADDLADGIAWSRRHWGSPLRPAYWGLALSLAWFRLDRLGRARRRLRRARERRRHGDAIGTLREFTVAALLAPEAAFYVGVYPRLLDRATRTWRTALDRVGQWGNLAPETVAYLELSDAWSDGWVGPRLSVSREIEVQAHSVGIRGWADLRYLGKPLVLTVRLNGRVVGRHRVGQPGDFLARIALPAPLPPGMHTVDVEASTWFVPDRHTGSGDLRPLAWRVGDVALDGAA